MGLGGYVRKLRRRGYAASGVAHLPPRTAFVLSGGGVLGAIQAGQLQALTNAGIIPDVLVGTSVGSLNAAFLACTPTAASADELAEIWVGVRTEDIFPGSRFSRAWHIVARGDHIYPNEGLRRLIERLPVRTFEETVVPLHISATNLRTGAEHWFTEGPLMRAVLASTALPGIFPPIQVDDELYVDGGVVNNAPISRAVDLGARKIYLLTCGLRKNQPQPIRRPLDVLVQAFTHSRAVRLDLDLTRYNDVAEIVVLPAVDSSNIRYNDLSQTQRLLDAARDIAARFLESESVAEA